MSRIDLQSDPAGLVPSLSGEGIARTATPVDAASGAASSKLDLVIRGLMILALTGPGIQWALGLRGLRTTFWITLEVMVIVVYIALTMFRGPCRAFWQSLAPQHRLVMTAFLGCMVFSQGFHSYSAMFPFIPWTMYVGGQAPPELLTVFDYIGSAQGEEFPINPSRLFISNGRGTRRMSNKLLHALEAAMARRDAGTADASSEAESVELLHAIGLEHNRQHPESRIDEMRVYRSEVDWKAREAPVKQRRSLIFQVPL